MPDLNPRPTNKDIATLIGLPVGVIMTWAIGLITPVPVNVATAIGSLVSLFAGYFIKEKIK